MGPQARARTARGGSRSVGALMRWPRRRWREAERAMANRWDELRWRCIAPLTSSRLSVADRRAAIVEFFRRGAHAERALAPSLPWFIRDYLKLPAQSGPRMISRPVISRYVEALFLPGRAGLNEQQGQIVWGRARGRPWKALAADHGLPETTVRRLYVEALDTLGLYLRDDAIDDLKPKRRAAKALASNETGRRKMTVAEIRPPSVMPDFGSAAQGV